MIRLLKPNTNVNMGLRNEVSVDRKFLILLYLNLEFYRYWWCMSKIWTTIYANREPVRKVAYNYNTRSYFLLYELLSNKQPEWNGYCVLHSARGDHFFSDKDCSVIKCDTMFLFSPMASYEPQLSKRDKFLKSIVIHFKIIFKLNHIYTVNVRKEVSVVSFTVVRSMRWLQFDLITFLGAIVLRELCFNNPRDLFQEHRGNSYLNLSDPLKFLLYIHLKYTQHKKTLHGN